RWRRRHLHDVDGPGRGLALKALRPGQAPIDPQLVLPRDGWHRQAQGACPVARGARAVREDVAERLETRRGDQREAHLEALTDLARSELEVSMDLERHDPVGWRRGTGWDVDLLHQVEQRHIVGLLIEHGAAT